MDSSKAISSNIATVSAVSHSFFAVAELYETDKGMHCISGTEAVCANSTKWTVPYSLNHALQELKEYRRAGIRTFADADMYEADKKRKSTVQPSLSTAAPGSLPRNWQYPGTAAAADYTLQVTLCLYKSLGCKACSSVSSFIC